LRDDQAETTAKSMANGLTPQGITQAAQ